MARKRREKRTGRRRARSKVQEWIDVVRKNELFEKYYKIQQIVPDDEFADFMEAIQRELPSTFRITGTRSHAQELLNAIKKFYLADLETVQIDGVSADPPKPLPWYPDELAWQINFTKKFIRKSSSMEKFHSFLVHETETGNISRQEAVSMIPPLLLDVKPGQKILDACAAPGSKTVQLIELLHGEETLGIPEGLVVANELQNKRCYMLVHQSKRLHSPCCLITNHDATLFPTLYTKEEGGEKVPIFFDRILCDVPCSGDGTLRKNPLIWKKWTPQLGMALFRIQLRILARAVEMLAPGGRIVYSTCTLNPVEDEAVVSTLLQKAEGAMELVDVSSYLPNLKRSPGLKTWKLMTKDLQIVDNCDPGSEHFSKGFKPQMLAPSEEVASKLHLERCMRIYPHQQDTGGFFIAVLEKKHDAPWENDKRYSLNRRLLPWESEANWQHWQRETKSYYSEKISYKMKLISREKPEYNTEKGSPCSDCRSLPSRCREGTSDEALRTPAQNSKETKEFVEEENTANSSETQDIIDEMDFHDAEMNSEASTTEENIEDDANSEVVVVELVKGHNAKQEPESRGENVGKEIKSTGKSGGKKGSGESDVVQPPTKRPKVEKKGFKEDPFVFLKDDDEHWPLIKAFYGIDERFPANQLLVRSFGGKKRNIYLVSKAVKDVMETIDDSHKVVNTGMKVIARSEADNVACHFRLMQEGIEALLPYITKRKVAITQEDVIILLTQDRPFCSEFSSTTRDQLSSIEGQGCIVYLYEPTGPYSKPEDTIGCRLIFCGWKAKVSTRLQISKFDKAHYQVLCGAPTEERKGLTSDTGLSYYCICLRTGTKITQKQEQVNETTETDCGEVEEAQPNDDEEKQHAGFIGDVLNVDAPEGSLDVGFI
ncbi:unnamed protein product [Porites evermanni]|uniref:tRNA (cytosine(34)-C(5))-methyltransferase n=1 Tax=Porites evermanni TaxID=104178 RepID=A0ABN8LV12_9CNID|nr:unnamed protein product [Porites evermanni]